MPEPDFTYVCLPIPDHKGILISPLVSRNYSITEMKEFLLKIDKDNGFEKWKDIELQLIRQDHYDSIWLVRWSKNGRTYYALLTGQEL